MTHNTKIERERKFLVKEMPLNLVDEVKIVQGYFGALPIRVRAEMNHTWNINDDIFSENIKEAFIGYKYPAGGSEYREESESLISPEIAIKLLEECGSRVLMKTRKDYYHIGHRWEICVFHGQLEGLITAEYEFVENTDKMPEVPSFIGTEVTRDIRYSNANLSLYENIGEIM